MISYYDEQKNYTNGETLSETFAKQNMYGVILKQSESNKSTGR